MRISTNWIKDFVSLDGVDLKELANDISASGVNIPIVENEVNATKLVIGYVLERKDHPNSDHLNVCKVDVGKETLQIVCGAANVDAGQKVIVSLVGAVLPGNFEIKKSTIRGVESNGMICALVELGLPDDGKDEIYVMDKDAPIGKNPLEYLGLDDVIYELDVKGDRKVDCTNYLGFAYEVATVLNRKIKLPNTSYKEVKCNDEFKLKVDTDNCSMYLGRLVKNIKIKESPEFIKNRLIASGMRPINNVVDISNYVMLEYGGPLHFFDADKLNNNICVRMAKKDEKVITLDDNERILDSEDIVITSNNNVVAIAGVMGCLNSEVENNTKNIFIESAVFEPLKVRKTSLKLDLRSESATRYERGLNSEYTKLALDRACYLLEKYAGGEVTNVSVKHEKEENKKIVVKCPLNKINKVLGTDLTIRDVEGYLKRLDFKYEIKDDLFIVNVPNRRRDVNIPEALIEEIGRLYGFHNLKAVRPMGYIKLGGYEPKTLFKKDISKFIRNSGLNECRTYTLIDDKQNDKFNYYDRDIIKLPNPISKDRTTLRVSLISSLLEVYDYNKKRNIKDINIYEISNIYYKDKKEYVEDTSLTMLMSGNYTENTWQKKEMKVDFYLTKAVIENLFEYLGLNKRYRFDSNDLPNFLHPGISAVINIDNEVVGYIGKIHPSIKKDDIYVLEINLNLLFDKKTSKLKYTEPNKYPSVKRDVAFLLKNNVKVGDIVKEINKNGNKILHSVDVFDVYDKEDEKSIGFTLTFEDKTKTLTEEEINNAFNKIINAIIDKFDAVLRDK